MTTPDDRPPGLAERYASATESSDLTPRMDRRCDADYLLAAGIAASKDPRKALALSAYKLGLSGGTTGLYEVVSAIDGWLLMRLARGGARPMSRPARQALLTDALQWWICPVCHYCDGRCFVAWEDAGRLSTVECEACHGTGQRALQVPGAHRAHAEHIIGELDRLVALIHADMARLLAQRMDL